MRRILPSPGAVIANLAGSTGVNESKIKNLYDELRKSGDAPVGVRGRYGVTVNSETAAKLLIAVCCSEHIKDAANAVQRYAVLEGKAGFKNNQGGVPIPSMTWESIADGFPRLAQLPPHHAFLDALVALIDSYVDAPDREEFVDVTFGSPFPWAKASVTLTSRESNQGVAIQYNNPEISDDEGYHEDDPEFLAFIDPSKERQRRRFAKLGGDLRLTMKITYRTLSALGALLRESTK
jgi:hypothetical protein